MHQVGVLENHYNSDKPVQTLLRLYGQNKKALITAIIFFYLKTIPVWILPFIFRNIVNIASKPKLHSVNELWLNAVIGLIAIALNPPFHMIYVRCMSVTCREAEAALRSAICRRLQMLTIAYYRHKSAGTIQSKTLRDVETIDQMIRGLFDGGLGALGAFAVAIGGTAWYAPQFLWFFLFTIPPIILIRNAVGRKLRDANREFRTEFEEMSSRITSMIDMIPVARAHAVEELEISKVDYDLGLVKKAGEVVDLRNGIFGSLAWSLFTMLNLMGYVVAGYVCFKQILLIDVGTVTLIGTFFAQISNSVTSIVTMFPNITKGFEAVRSIGEIIESPEFELDRTRPRIENVKGNVRFDNVEFRYPGSDTPAVKNLTLEIAQGSTIAFVGPSGSGKSTLMGLILGFNRPTEGRILLDGRDSSEIDMRSFREHVAVVSQDTILFQGTVRDNILYGTKNVGETELRRALRDANALDFIEKLPEGLDTMLGERGARISGGQKQRIAIARAIIREPRVLILDEATSALDVEAEYIVQEALDRLMAGRTTFIVAHRLSTIRNAGIIVLLDNGRICEIGTHQELLDQDKTFASMYHLQISGGRSYA
jgi:ATP-binding cassette subfamily B protein